jgi:hypothetical protein
VVKKQCIEIRIRLRKHGARRLRATILINDSGALAIPPMAIVLICPAMLSWHAGKLENEEQD